METAFVTKDSGKREEFASGMIRDTQEGKLRYDLAIDGPVFRHIFKNGVFEIVAADFCEWYEHGGADLAGNVVFNLAAIEGGFALLLERYSQLMMRGMTKYSEKNWMQANGMAEYNRFKQSAARHFCQYLVGNKDEDHAVATWFNMNGAEYVLGRMPKLG